MYHRILHIIYILYNNRLRLVNLSVAAALVVYLQCRGDTGVVPVD